MLSKKDALIVPEIDIKYILKLNIITMCTVYQHEKLKLFNYS